MPTSCPPQYVSQNIIHGSAQAVLYDLEAQITGATAHTRRSRLSLVCPAETPADIASAETLEESASGDQTEYDT